MMNSLKQKQSWKWVKPLAGFLAFQMILNPAAFAASSSLASAQDKKTPTTAVKAQAKASVAVVKTPAVTATPGKEYHQMDINFTGAGGLSATVIMKGSNGQRLYANDIVIAIPGDGKYSMTLNALKDGEKYSYEITFKDKSGLIKDKNGKVQPPVKASFSTPQIMTLPRSYSQVTEKSAKIQVNLGTQYKRPQGMAMTLTMNVYKIEPNTDRKIKVKSMRKEAANGQASQTFDITGLDSKTHYSFEVLAVYKAPANQGPLPIRTLTGGFVTLEKPAVVISSPKNNGTIPAAKVKVIGTLDDKKEITRLELLVGGVDQEPISVTIEPGSKTFTIELDASSFEKGRTYEMVLIAYAEKPSPVSDEMIETQVGKTSLTVKVATSSSGGTPSGGNGGTPSGGNGGNGVPPGALPGSGNGQGPGNPWNNEGAPPGPPVQNPGSGAGGGLAPSSFWNPCTGDQSIPGIKQACDQYKAANEQQQQKPNGGTLNW